MQPLNSEAITAVIVAMAVKDRALHQRLLEDPAAVIAPLFGVRLPDQTRGHGAKDLGTERTELSPPGDGELTDADLDQVAGGTNPPLQAITPALHTQGVLLQGHLTTALPAGLPAAGLPLPDSTQALAQLGPTVTESPDPSHAQASAELSEFMTMFRNVAQELRDSARQVRQDDLAQQMSTLNTMASQIRDAAADRFAQSIASSAAAPLATPLAGGLTGQALAGHALKSLGNMSQDHPAKGDWLAGQDRGTYSQLQLNKSLEAGMIGQVISSNYEATARKADLRDMEMEAASRVRETGVQTANDMMQQMMDVIRDVRDKLASIEQSRIETTRGIARNI